jgi:glycosyltransferase involved in cell wall biosynthesis
VVRFIVGFKDDVRPYLAIRDVVVLASHTIETFSIAALDAMAMGKPLVLTRSAALRSWSSAGKMAFYMSPEISKR